MQTIATHSFDIRFVKRDDGIALSFMHHQEDLVRALYPEVIVEHDTYRGDARILVQNAYRYGKIETVPEYTLLDLYCVFDVSDDAFDRLLAVTRQREFSPFFVMRESAWCLMPSNKNDDFVAVGMRHASLYLERRPPKWVLGEPKFEDGKEYTVAFHRDYGATTKDKQHCRKIVEPATTVFKALDAIEKDVSGKRKHTYYYVILKKTFEDRLKVHKGRFYFKATTKEIARMSTLYGVGVSVFVHDGSQWWNFPRWMNAKTTPFLPAAEYDQEELNESGILNNKSPAPQPAALPTYEGITKTEIMQGNGLFIVKTEKDGKTPWFWVSGDTLPVKDELRAAGGRWSQQNKAWYFIMDALPMSVVNLVEQTAVDAEIEELF